ncbi:MAG: hypothetical protein COT89_01250 [Candidatus Colwellbacteria bacterium CG10_big_fil_rev_8_21_14_0_10_42_22]|uniref:Uncharacterized protein n=1 Tax=Candidatus Colwellbacteria bacterium CG10_big_fil_rev_8_21_14_0_10_42_22 TaxID=1974540 RepID=A0A2H0VI64_9BACT|nr:MAG: hypothetical protein COT89_01250 [Candidatus Colwellbacteria bacterium CG10_big_fil_rev_8_21_14_0_10_42_22]
MRFNPFSKSEDTLDEEDGGAEEELSSEEKLKQLAYSMEALGVQGEQIIDISPEVREQLEKVHEFRDPETKGRIEYLLANPRGEKGTILVNSDFTADSKNRPTKEFLAYMAEIYPDYKIMFPIPPGYGTDPLGTFVKSQRKKERRSIFGPFARPALRALESIEPGEDIIIFGASMGSHLAVEQALAAQDGEIDLEINQVVLLAPPAEKKGRSILGAIRLGKDFAKDEMRSRELQEEYQYIKDIIPDDDVKKKEAWERHGLSGVVHMARYSMQLANSQFNEGLVDLVLGTDIDVRVLAGSEDSVAGSKHLGPAIEKIKAGGKSLKRKVMIGWRHGTTADIPRRVVNVIQEIGRGGPELLDAKMIAKRMQLKENEE